MPGIEFQSSYGVWLSGNGGGICRVHLGNLCPDRLLDEPPAGLAAPAHKTEGSWNEVSMPPAPPFPVYLPSFPVIRAEVNSV